MKALLGSKKGKIITASVVGALVIVAAIIANLYTE